MARLDICDEMLVNRYFNSLDALKDVLRLLANAVLNDDRRD